METTQREIKTDAWTWRAIVASWALAGFGLVVSYSSLVEYLRPHFPGALPYLVAAICDGLAITLSGWFAFSSRRGVHEPRVLLVAHLAVGASVAANVGLSHGVAGRLVHALPPLALAAVVWLTQAHWTAEQRAAGSLRRTPILLWIRHPHRTYRLRLIKARRGDHAELVELMAVQSVALHLLGAKYPGRRHRAGRRLVVRLVESGAVEASRLTAELDSTERLGQLMSRLTSPEPIRVNSTQLVDSRVDESARELPSRVESSVTRIRPSRVNSASRNSRGLDPDRLARLRAARESEPDASHARLAELSGIPRGSVARLVASL